MNSPQFRGSQRKRLRRGEINALKQRIKKKQQSAYYSNNLVVEIDKTYKPAQVNSQKSENPPTSVAQAENQNPKAAAVQVNQSIQKPQGPATPVPKSASQLEMERKFNRFDSKRQTQRLNNPIDFTADVTLPDDKVTGKNVTQKRVPVPVVPVIVNTLWGVKKGNKQKRPAPQTKPVVFYHQQSQFQAPHQDEPEDLTDDLAPHTGRGVQTPGTQPGTAAAENKLNFKFQRTALNQDWSEYQNKFRRIAGSPDHEGDALEIKQEKDKDQSMNTDSSNDNLRVSIPPIAGPSSRPRATPPQAVVAPRVEVQEKPKPSATATKPTSRFDQMTPYSSSGYIYTYDNYPKGIPRSFLQQEATTNAPQLNPVVQQSAYQGQAATVIPNQLDLPSWIMPGQIPQPSQPYEDLAANVGANTPAFALEEQTERAYSPSDAYTETGRAEEEPHEGSESPDLLQSGQKRLSAFKRLGPLTQPKKPKLTINLMLNKEQSVREVVNESEDVRYVPVHLRKDVVESEDDIVKRYLPFWPWKRNMVPRKTVSARFSKSVMILEQEQMEAAYEKDNVFIQVSVKGYPKTWTKEDVLDALLECVKGKTFIPLFIEFTPEECKFLVIRCRQALITIHKIGFCIRKGDVELTVSISLTDTSLNQIDLIPRLVLRKRLMTQYDGEKSLDLKEFLLQKDVSHFVYFPLSRHTNQTELILLQTAAEREHITELNLSHNRISNLDGFNLLKHTPRLKHLDLSYNYLDKVTSLLPLRELPLRSLKLEGNPLCHDYIDSRHYVKAAKMMFSGLMELDGIRIPLKGEFLPMKRNYCPESAAPLVEKFLETFFPLLEATYEDRATIEELYDKEAVMTITFRNKLRYGSTYRYFRYLFQRSRNLEEGDMESVKGSACIGPLINKWPTIQHDRYTITVDVMHHDDSTTILRVGGVLKLVAETLAEDEHLLQFTRNMVLHTRNGVEYKIYNEMLYWDVPCEEVAETAFNVTTMRPRQLSLKLESPPDEDLKYQLTDIFTKVTDIDRKKARRCLELKNWDLRSALEYCMTLLKHDNLRVLSDKDEDKTPVPQAS